jgi:hypothetical protein
MHCETIKKTGDFLQKLIVNQLLKKFPALCGTRSFLILLTRAFFDAAMNIIPAYINTLFFRD